MTAEQLNEALRNADESNPGAAIKEMLERTTTAERQRYEAQLAQIRQYGVENFAHFAEAAIRDRPNYKRYEKEIRGELDKVDPALRGSPQAWDYAYSLIVGRHAEELANEAAEEAVRKARETGVDSNLPGNTTPAEPPKLSTGEPVPTPKELGPETEAALRYKRTDPDALARSMGHYENWAELQEQINLPDPYEDDKFMFPKGKHRGPSFTGNRR
jgi:hypothetical protein